MIVGLALSPSLDSTYLVDDLRLGGISVPTRVVRSAGGKTLNASRVAASLGSRVAVIAVLGGHTGGRVASLLASSDIQLTTVDAGTETRTCVSIASSTTAGLTELYEQAPVLADSVWRTVLAELAGTILTAGDWLLLAGSVPGGVPLDELSRLLHGCRDRGIRVAVDTHGPALAAVVVASAADVIKVNRSEAVAFLGVASDLPAVELATALQAAAGCLVVVTDGMHGSCAVEEDAGGRLALRVHPDPVVGDFPVGSGDSYLGGLIHSLDAGSSLGEALRTAAACASANALEPGAAVFDSSAVDAARARIRVENAVSAP
jgi:1-phosphofructokinase family hexose kinase